MEVDPMSGPRRNERGLTLIEVMIALVVTTGIVLAGTALHNTTMKATASSVRRTSLSSRAIEVTERIARELQVCGFLGEDKDGDGVLDAGEDANRNERLDADWNLADETTASTITFNIMEPGWNWSDPVTYAVKNGVLLRTQSGRVVEICRGVQQFQLTRSGMSIDIALGLSGEDRHGETWSVTSERRAHVRN